MSSLLSFNILGLFTGDQAVIGHGDGALIAMALTLPAWAYQSVYGGSPPVARISAMICPR